ncbi:YegP family protein [uncultured Algoriphagus sp.]|uniref:YegP family protein n=1 Tax=uncultured Algoriphagus sp. TaxID=417365 RepID=UPI0030EF9569|tara:strand:+ start:199514 stop:199834 length:321 start_codon:yes stop_codon:yes gene_type:complete
MSKYVVKKATNGQFFWVLKAGNGETLLTSETYTTKQGCLQGISSSKNCVSDTNFRRLSSARMEPYFTQVANNYQVLGTSEMYSSSYARDQGIESVKRNAPNAQVED